MAVRKKQNQPIVAYGFKGMNNLPREPAVLLDRNLKATPRLAINVLVGDGGVILPRSGFAPVTGIPGLHSLWAESVMFGVGIDDRMLYLIEGSRATPLISVNGPQAPLRYAEVNGVVYISNPYFQAAYPLLTGSLRGWGVDLPPAPTLLVTSGSLPPGTYTLAYTQVMDGQVSGNGPLVQVSWEGAPRGIRLTNFQDNYQLWMTQPNGKKLQLAEVESNEIVGSGPMAEPLLQFMCGPPPKFTDFCFNFGRIWGARGKRLYYSFPGFPEWFRVGDLWPFPEDIVLLAPVNGGIFVNSVGSTWYLYGSDPEKMEVSRIGDGAIPGTMVMAKAPASLAGGAATSANFGTLSQMPTPVWLSPTGFVVGTHTGHLTHLTYHRLKMVPRNQGAGFFRVKDGVPQIVVSLRGVQKDIADPELDQIFENGRLF